MEVTPIFIRHTINNCEIIHIDWLGVESYLAIHDCQTALILGQEYL